MKRNDQLPIRISPFLIHRFFCGNDEQKLFRRNCRDAASAVQASRHVLARDGWADPRRGMDNPDCWPEIGLQELTPEKSASVYECIRFIWPHNAQTIELASPPLMSWIGNDGHPCRH